jgi:predicted ATPase/class 3 adenylate cyclase
MADLPSGTVTFLLTDIEGSTSLWEHQREAMPAALARHDALLTTAVSLHGGTVVKSRGEGDSLFAVFARPSDAVAAALTAQRALTPPPAPPPAARGEGGTQHPGQTRTPLSSEAEEGPEEGVVLRVRMAIHTGEAELRDGDYYGTAVNRCARLRAIAHGGQVLISAATQELVRDSLPADAGLANLGAHRLRDLARPEQVFQLTVPDLPSDFPPLRSLDAHPHNLPLQPTALVGREHEVKQLTDLVRDGTRLVTLTGPGGTGKTRLALQTAAELLDDFADGVFFVPLAPITDPGLVESTIALTLGMPEAAGRPLREAVNDYLRSKALLLVLDNFEQIVVAAPLVSELLAACAGVSVLVTSRIVLRLRGEHEYPVPPLATPTVWQPAAGSRQWEPRDAPDSRLPTADSLRQYAAVALFIQRAQEAKPDFIVTNDTAPAVAEICARLDGLPLAIELAAARIKALPPRAMLARLEHRLTLLTGGARDLPARQQTLRDAIAWSYDLLTPDEQSLFRRLAVFVGGCSLEAAEAINLTPPAPLPSQGRGETRSATVDQPPPFPAREGGPGGLGFDVLDGITSLLDNSLLKQEDGPGGEPRYRMLETIREYALEQLAASGEEDRVRHAQVAYFTRLAEDLRSRLMSPALWTWLPHLQVELDNLRASLTWSLSVPEGNEMALRLTAALMSPFGPLTVMMPDASALLEQVLVKTANHPPALAPARALVLAGAAAAAWNEGDFAAAHRRLDEALAEGRRLADGGVMTFALHQAGLLSLYQGDHATARERFGECVALLRDLNQQWMMAMELFLLGDATLPVDRAAARAHYEECMALAQQMNDMHVKSFPLGSLARLAMEEGDYHRARLLAEEAVAIRRTISVTYPLSLALATLAEVARCEGAFDEAAALSEESLALGRDLGNAATAAWSHHNLGHVALAHSNTAQAADHFAESLRLARGMGQQQRIAASLLGMAGVAVADGGPERAARLFGAAAAILDALQATVDPADRAPYERDREKARAALGGEAFQQAWDAGRTLSPDEAVALALRESLPR